MSLPWFPFNIKGYLSDTMALTTQEHGAYLLLMLHYYATETPPPDNDRKLAAICKVSPSDWQEVRGSLEPYFQIKDGAWHHQRIEDEIRNGHVTHSAGRARTAAATAAAAAKRHATKPATDTVTVPPRTRKPSRLRDEAETIIATMSVASSVTDTPIPKPTPINSLSPKAFDEVEEGQAEHDIADTMIAEDFQPSLKVIEACHAEGVTDEIINREIKRFIGHHREKASFSANWDASFSKWFAGRKAEKPPAPAKAAPRVVVNKEPEATDWDKACAMFARNQSNWMRGIGPEPGMPGCKCPPEHMTKHGIDPETGIVRKAKATAS